jgi:cation diffusion facilitator CzcD-associated flavoprotein CzcO
MTGPDYEVVVIGAGPGGLCAGTRLKQAGIERFAILERAGDIGGSWRDNTYPGIGVDIPSLTYQFSFARNPEWSRLFPRGAEVKAYHDAVADRFGLRPQIKLNTEVVRERWDESEHCWALEIADGRTITARFVISAIGAFLRPKRDPGIAGHADFVGKLQEPARWDHSYDYAGKRIAVIGTGASSVQIVPEVAQLAAQVDVYQRTPVWCLPKPDYLIGPRFRRALHVPGVAAGFNGLGLVGAELGLSWMSYAPPAIANPSMRLLDTLAKRAYGAFVRRRVKDPETAAALTPDYGPLGKRPTISNAFLQTFNRPNTHLITTPIERITVAGVRTADGIEREVDMLVLATGYELFSDPESYEPGGVVGRDGFDLARFFADEHLQAYESVSIPNLPNRWIVVGPYSWSGTGWHAFVEITTRHATRAIVEARRRGATAVEVRRRAHESYHASVRRHARNIQHYYTVQNRGLRTYYVNSHGENAYIRPSGVFQAIARSHRFPLEDYSYTRLPAAARQAEPAQPLTVAEVA